mgnify:CR=1 FL=1
MLLSKSCEYGLRASILLASGDQQSYTSIRDISSRLDISFHFLTKIFQKLNSANLLDSKKGVNGGVKLSMEPADISFMDIVLAIDGSCSLNACALGLPGCGEKRPCPMHDQWSAIKSGLIETMKNITMNDLAEAKGDEWNLLLHQLNNSEMASKAEEHGVKAI